MSNDNLIVYSGRNKPKKHGLYCGGNNRHPLAKTWWQMKARCYEASHVSYKNYGGRGIVVCDEWKKDILAFVQWAESHGWQRGLQIDRIDNDGNYEPSNCRFVTAKQNCRNRRNNRLISAFGETKTFIAWAEDPRCIISENSLWERLAKGISAEVAIAHPPIPGRKIVIPQEASDGK